MSQGERRLAAIMFTDMVGYTALGQRNEALSLSLVEEQRKIIRPILDRHGGREVKTMGDAFLVEFRNALDAVRCAYDVQRGTREFNISLPEDRRVHLRVGVHLGDVVELGGDISGDAVNIASRIEPLAEDGGVCLSRQVFDHVQNKFELPFVSLGMRSLKNVTAPVEVFRIVMPWEEEPRSQQVQVDKKRIAVLPLSNISQDQSDEYFADGMTEELINALSHVQGLKVIARTSVARYRGDPKPVSEIGRELGVGSVMEGSVRKSGDRIRVTAQLIDVATEEHLWSENYDRKLEDVFAIQSDVAGMVAEVLKAKLLGDERKRLESGYTAVPAAYDKYLLARYSPASTGMLARLRHYEEAIELDPRFALAYADLASYYVILSGDFMPPGQAFSKAKECLAKAFELDNLLPNIWSAKADLALQYEWNTEEAERCVRRAIELNPSDARAYGGLSYLSDITGRYDDAVTFALKFRALDPYPPFPDAFLSFAYAFAGRRDEAIRELARMDELYPDLLHTRLWVVLTYGLLSMTNEAVRELDTLHALIKAKRDSGTQGWIAGVPPGFYALCMFSYAAVGQNEKIRSSIRSAEEAAGDEHVGLSAIATLYLASGDKSKAFELFEKSIEERDAGLIMYSHFLTRLMKQSESFYNSIISDPDFISLLRRVGVR